MSVLFNQLKNGDIFQWTWKEQSHFYREKYLMVNKSLNSPGQCIEIQNKEKNFFSKNDNFIKFKILNKDCDDTGMDFL